MLPHRRHACRFLHQATSGGPIHSFPWYDHGSHLPATSRRSIPPQLRSSGECWQVKNWTWRPADGRWIVDSQDSTTGDMGRHHQKINKFKKLVIGRKIISWMSINAYSILIAINWYWTLFLSSFIDFRPGRYAILPSGSGSYSVGKSQATLKPACNTIRIETTCHWYFNQAWIVVDCCWLLLYCTRPFFQAT